MIPVRDSFIADDYKIVESPTRTYKMELYNDDFDKNIRIKGYTDQRAAMEQAIYKITLTERYWYVIYSWNYGIEIKELFGQPIPYCCAELERRIKEALLHDNRIVNVYDFEFENPEFGVVYVKYRADTVFGTLDLAQEVKLKNV